MMHDVKSRDLSRTTFEMRHLNAIRMSEKAREEKLHVIWGGLATFKVYSLVDGTSHRDPFETCSECCTSTGLPVANFVSPVIKYCRIAFGTLRRVAFKRWRQTRQCCNIHSIAILSQVKCRHKKCWFWLSQWYRKVIRNILRRESRWWTLAWNLCPVREQNQLLSTVPLSSMREVLGVVACHHKL